MFLFTTPASGMPTAPAAPHGAALERAAGATGVSFSYLVETARRESNFRSNAQAATSSARGLYQFIADTWLRTLKTEGPKIGLGKEAGAITLDGSGRAHVADAVTRERLLALRDDPAVSARLAAALARDNAAALTARLGRAPSDGEVYIAHFLGASAAARLIEMKQQAPQASAAAAFSAAAGANRSVFYGRDGAPRTVAAVYAQLVSGFATKRDVSAPDRAFAEDTTQPFFSLFRSAPASRGDEPSASLAAAAALWANPAKPGRPLDLNAFRVRSWWA